MHLLAEAPFMGKLAKHIVDFELSEQEASLQPDHFSNICLLTGLTRLHLQGYSYDLAPGCVEISSDISRLLSLRSLLVHNRCQDDIPHVTVSAELSQLQALTFLDLAGCHVCFAQIAFLSSLQELRLSMSYDTWLVPSCMQGLQSLTYFSLNSITLGGDLSAISGLVSLEELIADDYLEFQPASCAQDFLQAVGGLSRLRELVLRMPEATEHIHLAALSGLSSMTKLDMGCNLTAFECCSGWHSLQLLCLQHNCLSRMPGNLAALSALTKLDIGYQHQKRFQVTEPLDFLQSMPKLQVLQIIQTFMGYYHYNVPPHRWSPTSVCFIAEAQQEIQDSLASRPQIIYLHGA